MSLILPTCIRLSCLCNAQSLRQSQQCLRYNFFHGNGSSCRHCAVLFCIQSSPDRISRRDFCQSVSRTHTFFRPPTSTGRLVNTRALLPPFLLSSSYSHAPPLPTPSLPVCTRRSIGVTVDGLRVGVVLTPPTPPVSRSFHMANIVICLSPYLLLSLINLPSARVATFRSDATSTGSQARSDDIHTVGKNIPLSHLISMLVRFREPTRL